MLKALIIRYIIKTFLVFLVFFAILSMASSEDQTMANANRTILSTAIGILDTAGDLIFSYIRVVLWILVLILLAQLILWIKRDDNETLILPFQIIKNNNNYDGTAIADLLIAELQRIKCINDDKYEGIQNEDLRMPPQKLSGETDSISQIGTISMGPASISIGEMMITIKKLFRRGFSRQIIAGNLEDCGPRIKIVACLKGDKSCTCEVQTKANSEAVRGNSLDDFDIPPNKGIENNSISDLVRDLSFKIAYNLSKDSISTKTLMGFKHCTEALANYKQYMNTKETNYLDFASDNCIRLSEIETNYPNTFNLFFYLGIAYFNETMYNKADKMFGKALEQDPKSAAAWANKSNTQLRLMNTPEALKAAQKAIDLNPDSEAGTVALINKSVALCASQDYDRALEAAKNAINLDPDDDLASAAWTNVSLALFYSKKFDDELLDAAETVIKLNKNNQQVSAAWTFKAFALFELGRSNEEVLKAADEALDLNPINMISILALIVKSVALRKMGDNTNADIAYAKAKDLGFTD